MVIRSQGQAVFGHVRRHSNRQRGSLPSVSGVQLCTAVKRRVKLKIKNFQTSNRSDRQAVRYFGSRVWGVRASQNVRVRRNAGVENARKSQSERNYFNGNGAITKQLTFVTFQAVYLVNSGSEANELAMQLARLHSGNQDVLSVQNCYHGVTGNLHGLTALSSTRYNNLPAGHSVHHVMCPDVFKGIWGGKKCRDSPVQTQRSCDCGRDRCQAADKYYEQIEEVFSYSIPRGKVAAFFAESIQVRTVLYNLRRSAVLIFYNTLPL